MSQLRAATASRLDVPHTTHRKISRMGKKTRGLVVDAPAEIMAQRPEHCALENAHPLTSHWVVVKGWLVPCRITLPEAAQ